MKKTHQKECRHEMMKTDEVLEKVGGKQQLHLNILSRKEPGWLWGYSVNMTCTNL